MAAPDFPNPAPGPSVPPKGQGLLAGWTAQHTAWLLFGPLAVMGGTRWILQSISDRQSATPAPPLVPVATTSGALDLLWPVAVVLALLLAAGFALRRIGWRRCLPVLGGAWLLLCLYGSAALLQRHLNREGLFLQDGLVSQEGATVSAGAAPVMARVVASQFKKPSQRSLGGTELVLQLPGLDIPQRLLINDPQAETLKNGDALALQLVPGRFSGLFVTGWQALPSAGTAPATPVSGTPEPAESVSAIRAPATPASASATPEPAIVASPAPGPAVSAASH
ncbi:MAG: hypothetical protein M3R45_01825 [Pseudomonadota bacterium]|nr:hypothetical protein [Pseudomonadota bacterium]